MCIIGEDDVEGDEVASALSGVGHGVDLEFGAFSGVDNDSGILDGRVGKVTLPTRVGYNTFFIGCWVDCSDPWFCNDDYVSVGNGRGGALIVI